MNAQLSLEMFPIGHPACAMLAELTRDTTRAARLTSLLLAYAGKGRVLINRIDLTTIVRAVASRA
jgi:hypothetical protein